MHVDETDPCWWGGREEEDWEVTVCNMCFECGGRRCFISFSLSRGLSSLSEKKNSNRFLLFQNRNNERERTSGNIIDFPPSIMCQNWANLNHNRIRLKPWKKNWRTHKKNNNIFACFNSTTYFLWYLAFFWLKNKYFSVFSFVAKWTSLNSKLFKYINNELDHHFLVKTIRNKIWKKIKNCGNL